MQERANQRKRKRKPPISVAEEPFCNFGKKKLYFFPQP